MYVVNSVLLKLRPELYQVQLLSYKCQLGHKLFNVKPMDTILSALNVSQGHPHSY